MIRQISHYPCQSRIVEYRNTGPAPADLCGDRYDRGDTCIFSYDGCLLGSILELCRYLYFWGERGSHDGRRNRGSLEDQ